MEDEEVGELWAYAHDPKPGYNAIVAELIRKLVEEAQGKPTIYSAGTHLQYILKRFGIDPRTFK